MNGVGAWQTYDIHGITRIRTNLPCLGIPERFQVESDRADLEFGFVPRLEPLASRQVRREAGFRVWDLADGEIRYETDIPIVYLLGARERWSFSVRGLGNEHTRILTSIPYFGFAPVRYRTGELLQRLAHVILVLKLLDKGFSICHAASLAHGDEAHLLFGYGGTGKSSLASGLLDSGFEYMSEDFTLFDARGNVLCYPEASPPRSAYATFPLRNYLRGGLPRWKLEKRIRDRAKLSTILVLEKGPARVEPLDPDEAVRRLTLLDLEEFSKMWNSPISILVNYYAYFHPEFALADFLTRYRSTLASFVERSKACFAVRSPTLDVSSIRRVLLEGGDP